VIPIDPFAPGLDPDVAGQIQRYFATIPDPEGAAKFFARFCQARPDAFQRIARSRPGLHYLITTFAYSRFLSEEVLQHPHWIEDLVEREDLHRVYLADEYLDRLRSFLVKRLGSVSPDALSLAQFRRKAILRIMLRDVLGFGTLSEIMEELSNLADAILEIACRSIRNELVKRYGYPMESVENGARRLAGFTVIALGKHGGTELNYSSDIDLMFVYSANGQTGGAQPISNKEFYKKLSTQLTSLLSTYTAEGFCYRVDLRLRPEGTLGEVCMSLEGAKAYYASRARDWELQMLIKARVAAGDPQPGRELLEFVEPLIYRTTLDFSAVEAMSATRDRIDEKLAARRSGNLRNGLDVKLARGGIRDIEFLVQCLQRLHGGRTTWVRHGGTLLALLRLQDKNLLSATEYGRLASAYEFLRHLEHRLQMVEDRQTHTLPSDPGELDLLARRMPGALLRQASRESLLQQLNAHLEHVTTLYERVIHAQKPIYYSQFDSAEADGAQSPTGDLLAAIEPAEGNLIRSLDETSPSLASQLAGVRRARRSRVFELFLERVALDRDLIQLLDADAALSSAVLELFEHSPYFAEELLRYPELIHQVQTVSGEAGPAFDFTSIKESINEPAELRREFRRQMVRIQAESICRRAPIFTTLGRTSDLADAAIAAAYRMAVAQVLATRPPRGSGYTVEGQLMVIALGRLGMREFDLASDADLVFIIPDADHTETVFWTHVAERTIDLLTAYTGEGFVFSVDTRLRPNGRAGALVQTAGSCRDYFDKHAEAWEGIAWMKSRAIAGNMNTATDFLHSLQEVDWRRWGQSGRSKKDLRQMRLRLEKEQGSSNPLKAGRGGYYDIDFTLMYLRLKGAGFFFKVLNTPERIDILEKMGHLERDDAAFLREAASFYRSVDHALRVFSGHAEGSLPQAEEKLAALEELTARWAPAGTQREPLPARTARIQQKTRELFDRFFG
jgi:glutamate-ammonia-ligase adenylyltransferase